ncbi:MAG: methyltransferase domain-containing protein [Chloroflexi bacterium]|nr:methyltransferase domain-containing protein [Chloroflexota bacterium]
MEFVEPRRLARPPALLFDAAYRGTEHGGGFDDFAHRVRQRDALLVDPTLWFWSPAFSETMNWLRSWVPDGRPILEIGCGLGFFLHALRREGFAPVGLDVASMAVELNRKDGFAVWHGTLDTMPEGWVEPAAVVVFFMLHHVEEPLQLLQDIRSRWPQARVALAQYGPSNVRPHSSEAPRNLTKWNATALREAFERAGYEVEVRNLASNGTEGNFLVAWRSALFEFLIRVPSVYRGAKRVLDPVVSRLARRIKQEAYVLLAFAEPTSFDTMAPP